jgi:NADP-dependent aldehyde dehydrogenase
MNITGKHFIGGERSAAGTETFSITNPSTNAELTPRFAEATVEEVNRCLYLADKTFGELQQVDSIAIASLLDEIATGLEHTGEPLLARIQAETALSMQRLESECARTVSQTRMFAQLVREGGWVQARIDHGNPERKPLPKPDVRTMLTGIGPVAVFGASNFPLAISVAGTDTIAAFAAKCPVVVKAHPGHPGTCELIAELITQAIQTVGLPAGMFAMLQGASHEVGLALVEHPLTAAAAFTGSLRGGRALFDAAAQRPAPIPVYAEMGSTNPVFVLPGAARERADKIATGYIQSVTLGVGQFCTNPGLLFIERGQNFDTFCNSLQKAVAQTTSATMLHTGTHSAFEAELERIANLPDIAVLARASASGSSQCEAACTIFTTTVDKLANYPELAEEVFGPSSVVFECQNVGQMLEFARSMQGHLTATIHGTEQDLADNAEFVRVLERKVGRIVFNGFPTGIEVGSAIHHGGPFPATTHSHFTSIGSFAISRFTKPVCYQNFPDAALPIALRNRNVLGIARIIDGEITTVDA